MWCNRKERLLPGQAISSSSGGSGGGGGGAGALGMILLVNTATGPALRLSYAPHRIALAARIADRPAGGGGTRSERLAQMSIS